ncbi:hypothetical protein [Aureimonas leprariae]|uniref:Uncharacterized protein n=1 Tax=Plantimonas leprariae TaxID=2615207 RepID=A0A7V7TUY1_9HYPH|nr:hypothetical protein [Aureimonas leprariae]KAB0676856.1 hypothetical protein F6X38_20000 [Aureimonas leprariae]
MANIPPVVPPVPPLIPAATPTTSIFHTENGNGWGQSATVNAGAYGAAQDLSSLGTAAMTIDVFVKASRQEQVDWVGERLGRKPPQKGDTLAFGDFVATVEERTEKFQRAEYSKNAQGQQLYDASGKALIKYVWDQRQVQFVSIRQKDGQDGLQKTAGEQEALIPYFNQTGSSATGGAAYNAANAENLFPTIDGIDVKLPENERPPGFGTKPSSFAAIPDLKADGSNRTERDTAIAKVAAFLAEFNTWHPAYQAEWMNLQVKNGESLSAGVVQIPKTGTAVATLVVSATRPKDGAVDPGLLRQFAAYPRVYTVEQITKNDFATMPASDQSRISNTDAFKARAKEIGLSVDRDVYVGSPNGLITLLEDVINKKTGTYNTEVVNGKTVGKSLPAEAKSAFIDQLEILRGKLNGMSVFSDADIQKEVKDLRDRFERLVAFWDVRPGSYDPANARSSAGANYSAWIPVYTSNDKDAANKPVSVPRNVISLDDNQTINNGYKTFLVQEQRIRDMAATRNTMANGDGTLNGKKLDVPGLIYYFQNQYNLEGEAKVVADTEEVKQQNAYLQTISEMQRLVNQVLTRFGKEDKSVKTVGDLGENYFKEKTVEAQSSDPATRAEARRNLQIIAMFNSRSGQQPHPLEKLRGFTRQTIDLTQPINNDDKTAGWKLTTKDSGQWGQYGTQLSEMVTIVNQSSQLQMNNINSEDRQRNRYYDLANSALQKLGDMVQNIAHAT